MPQKRPLEIDSGVLRVKQQFRIEHVKRLNLQESAAEAPKNNRGQNKRRTITQSRDDIQLCNELAAGAECTRPNCRQTHDKAQYLASKLPDIGTVCPVYTAFGTCKFGIKCRFAGAHTNADGTQMNPDVNHTITTERSLIRNNLPNDFLKKLRKNAFVLPKSAQFKIDWEAQLAKDAKKAQESSAPGTMDTETGMEDDAPPVPVSIEVKDDLPVTTEVKSAPTDIPVSAVQDDATDIAVPVEVKEDVTEIQASVEVKHATPIPVSVEVKEATKEIVVVSDSDINIKPTYREKKTLDFKGKTYLAPLTTVGNMPFRRICKGFGVDITCGEMTLTSSLLQGSFHEWIMMRRHKSEDIFGVQLTGPKHYQFAEICETIEQNMDIDFLDINLGCPIDLVCNMGAGSALMGKATRLKAIVAGAVSVLSCPLTVKIRTGITDKKLAHTLIPQFQSWGVAAVTLHGRSKKQRYTKNADWDYISECAKLVDSDKMAFFGNGDIFNPEDYENHLKDPNLSGVMVGRGALIKPWIFKEFTEGKLWDISANERFDILNDYSNFGMELWGSDTQGVNQTRRFLCEWMSFYHRYVPVGIIETLPQRFSQRPERFMGRSDMETLLSSSNAADWVKISEMILGPAPESFKFIPKHKSSSYEVPSERE